MGATASFDHELEDITDLEQARRVIAELKCALAQATQLTDFDDGQFTIFLDDQHADMVVTLFEQQRLVARQDPACELHDALSDFVCHWLDRQSSMRQHDHDRATQPRRRVTPSA